MSTHATGGIKELGREAGGARVGGSEHVPVAQIVHHDAGEDSRHLRQQRGGRIEESSSALLTHAQCLIEASHMHAMLGPRQLGPRQLGPRQLGTWQLGPHSSDHTARTTAARTKAALTITAARSSDHTARTTQLGPHSWT